jgi:hypothetical protein
MSDQEFIQFGKAARNPHGMATMDNETETRIGDQVNTGIDSAAAKIIRASEHLDEINRIIADVISKIGAYEIIKDANGKETVNFLIQPPLTVSILAGEIVYQLRSAIDHLAFELVQFNPTGIVLPSKWEENCLFPLWLTPPKKSPAYNCFKGALPGISKGAFAFIESMQPYRSGEGHHNVMAIIAKLSNIDKHRHLNAILPRVAVRQDFESARGLRSTTIVGGLKHGAEVQPLVMTRPGDPIVDMKLSYLPYVTFEEIAIGAGPATLEAQNVLELCVETVKNVVIPAFIQLLKKP